MKRGFVSVALAAMCLGMSSASAAPLPPNSLDTDEKAWFYNKVGATQAEALADLEACLKFGGAIAARPTGAGGAYGLIGVLVEVAVTEAMSKGPARAISDDCMMSLGYRRYDAADANMSTFTTRFTQMDTDARAALMGAETPPEGVLARQWANSFWLRRDGDAPDQSPRSRVGLPTLTKYTAASAVNPLADDAAIAPKPSEAVIVASIRLEGGGRTRPLVSFTRDNRETGQPDPVAMGASQRMRWAVFNVRADKVSDTPAGAVTRHVFVVPSGFYGLASATTGMTYSNFCFGTVAFEAAPGAVVDLGEIVVRPGAADALPLSPAANFQLRFNPATIEANRAILARAPALAARLAPAEFKNGFARSCNTVGALAPAAYGFEIPGAAWLNGVVTPTAPAATVAATPPEASGAADVPPESPATPTPN